MLYFAKPLLYVFILIVFAGTSIQETNHEEMDLLSTRRNTSKTTDDTENKFKSEDSPLQSAHECQSKDEELDEATIIKNHLDPVPFPEPAYDRSPPYRYILWSESRSPIKVFKETAV